MDFNFINEHIPLYVEAAKLTLIMAFWGILLAIVVGLIVSLIRYFKVPVLDKIVGFYIVKKHTVVDSVIFLIFWIAKGWNCTYIGAVWCYRIGFPWRKLYGRGF